METVQTSRSRETPRALVGAADLGTRKLLQEVLNRCGMATDIVDNEVVAVTRARRKRPNLIITDLQLRDSSGLQLIQWLRSNAALKSTPVILLTTNANDICHSKVWAADAVMLKPVSPEAIESMIRDVVNQERV